MLKRWFTRTFLHELDLWSGLAFVLCLLILLPLLALLLGMRERGPLWEHLAGTVLSGYVINTLWLTVSVALLSILMAVPAAWLLSHFEFPGRPVLEWAMVLPLAVPTYVAAFVYKQIPEAAIPLLIHIRSTYGIDTYLFAEAFIRKAVLALFMAAVLYPYLYLSLRAAFMVQRRGVIEAAQVLGRGPTSVFFSIALPLARPALIAGVSLIGMEVLNDYGAVYFMGVPTLTVGIFRTWTGLGDLASAVRLAGLMMLGILIVLGLESRHRGRARFSETADDSTPFLRHCLSRRASITALLTCLIPLSLGFIVPLLQLFHWAYLSTLAYGNTIPWQRMGHSLTLSLGAATVLTLISVVLIYAQRLHPVRWLQQPIRLAGLGYAIPGAVVAVGVMIFLGYIDQRFTTFTFIGSVHAIGFGYVVRFLAVGIHPVRAGMERVCGSLDAASRILGHSPTYTLFRINLPLIRGTLLAVTMLVFVDILKELPLTMILRPVDFDTLATLAFGLANDSRIQECAIPSLLIIFLATLGLFGLNRMLRPAKTSLIAHEPRT
jgi:iron(III) transport system permease protein